MKKHIPLAILFTFCFAKTFAQSKLKDVQPNSLWASANIKIDGNLSEWKNDFQAYNTNTKLYYILSNDDKYLYLVVQSTDATNNAKIAAGGITLTINTADKKKDKDAFAVTYPLINRANRGQRGQRGPGGGFGGRRNGGAPLSDSAATAAANEAHKQFIESSKEIKVFGFKDITDTVISIYNEYSIKAAIGYNDRGNFTYELALPLKALGLSADSPKEFAYNVKLNGLQIPSRNNDPNGGGRGNGIAGGDAGGAGGGFGGGGAGGGGRGGRGGGGGGFGGGGRGGPGGADGGRNNIDFQELSAPTDFWGKYTLAKK
jgi:hypothetical protein